MMVSHEKSIRIESNNLRGKGTYPTGKGIQPRPTDRAFSDLGALDTTPLPELTLESPAWGHLWNRFGSLKGPERIAPRERRRGMGSDSSSPRANEYDKRTTEHSQENREQLKIGEKPNGGFSLIEEVCVRVVFYYQYIYKY
jgi:hypothetical protein